MVTNVDQVKSDQQDAEENMQKTGGASVAGSDSYEQDEQQQTQPKGSIDDQAADDLKKAISDGSESSSTSN